MMALLFLILVTPEIMDAIALAGWMQRLGGPFTNDTLGVPFGMLRLWVGPVAVRERRGDAHRPRPPRRASTRRSRKRRPTSVRRQDAHSARSPCRSSAPALIAGGLLSFTLCLDNTIISSLISGASSTFPVALISATKSEIKPFWGVGAVVLFVMTMALLAFVAPRC